MSADDVACVRRLFEAFNAGDAERALADLHPAAELYPMRAQLEGNAYRGHDGYRQILVDVAEDWASMRMEFEGYEEGQDCVVVHGRIRARGRASGVEIDVPMGWVWRFRDGRASYAKAYSERADALRAAGLEASTETTA